MDDDEVLPSQRVSQRELDEWERDRQVHERPNVEPRLDPHYRPCVASKYSTHRFVFGTKDRLIRCEFCGLLEIDVRVG